MVVNQKVTGTASSMPGGLAMGGAVSLLVTLGGSGIFGYLISKEILPETATGYCAMTVIFLSAVLGAAMSASRIKRRRLFVCAVSGMIYYGLLLSMTALFFGGQYQGILVTGLLILGGCGTVVLLGMRQKKSPYGRKRKYGNR